MKVGGLIPGELQGSTWVAYNIFRRRLLLKGGGCTSMAVCNRRFSAPVPRKRREVFLRFSLLFIIRCGVSLGYTASTMNRAGGTKKRIERILPPTSSPKPQSQFVRLSNSH